jgi:hypothetical protein
MNNAYMDNQEDYYPDLVCDQCGTNRQVSGTWYGSILCANCEAMVERIKTGGITEQSQQAESTIYSEQEAL